MSTLNFNIVFKIFQGLVSALLFIHGAMRLYLWEDGIPEFGAWLNQQGFVIGNVIAVCITGFELIGGILMAIGKFSKWIAPVFMLYLAAGIVMVHAKNGWFVVGHALDGVEYNVLLIGCLLLIFFNDLQSVQKSKFPA